MTLSDLRQSPAGDGVRDLRFRSPVGSCSVRGIGVVVKILALVSVSSVENVAGPRRLIVLEDGDRPREGDCDMLDVSGKTG